MGGVALIEKIISKQDVATYQELHWEGTYQEYLERVKENPLIVRSAFQYLRDMVLSYGQEEYTRHREKLIHYKFFDDPIDDGKDALYGLDKPLMALVDVFNSAANRYGTERRILLLHGPVGTAKSTIVRLLKKGLETYSYTDEGQIYTFTWNPNQGEIMECPMHEEPLKLVPFEYREMAVAEFGLGTEILGDLCPACQFVYDQLLELAGGDWTKVVAQVRVKRLLLSEKKRVGIGTFQPRDEKNQDSTELTGDINYRKIAIYGSDSDPRAFNFDGELNVANRGLVEFIEILKLDVAFLYDLLTASQEHKIKPKKFAHTDIDEVLIGHTNNAEYNRLLSNEFMEALRDRTIRIDVPYNLRYSDEVKIYERDYASEKVRGKHIAPHTLELAALWAILTRLEEPKHIGLTLLQKQKLYDGKSLAGFTDDTVIELMAEHPREGMEEGISPRYIQDMLANILVSGGDGSCVNPFKLLRELERGLDYHSLITDEKVRTRYKELLAMAQEELDDILKNEIQHAIVADKDAIERLCGNYIDNVKAYTQKKKVRNPITNKDEPPNEALMRSIEEKIEIAESRKDDFRREIMNFIGALALDGVKFDWKANERLRKALELKLFEEQKDTIKLNTLVSNVVDPETQKKIDIVKARMLDDMGYCDECATDVLNYVSSIFARGDSKDDE